jgi:hypothetical protein
MNIRWIVLNALTTFLIVFASTFGDTDNLFVAIKSAGIMGILALAYELKKENDAAKEEADAALARSKHTKIKTVAESPPSGVRHAFFF